MNQGSFSMYKNKLVVIKMNKIITSLAALAMCTTLAAQETSPKISLYGFIRNYYAFDTRESVAGTEDFFYYLPKDENMKGDVDLNEQNSLRFAAITSRIGLNVIGYEYDGFKMGAKIETDFYNGLSGVTGTAVLRIRQAYVNIGKNNWLVTAGQAWHPMAADMPDVFSLNTGAPFGPFSRTPQVKLDYNFSDALSLTASALWQMQYTSTGPDGASANYIKYGCTPELYAGLNYKKGGLLLRAGLNMLSIKPRHTTSVDKVDERITTFIPFFYGQYKKGLFSIKAKTVFAEAGEHVNLNGGYGISNLQKGTCEYTPTRNSSTWVSLMYGKKTQWILFGGYVKNFGTKDDLFPVAAHIFMKGDKVYVPASNLYFSKNSFSNMNQMWRLTPTVIHNIGKFSIGLEYEITSVQYGDYQTFEEGNEKFKCIGINGLAEDNLHWITNNRLQALVKFTF